MINYLGRQRRKLFYKASVTIEVLNMLIVFGFGFVFLIWGNELVKNSLYTKFSIVGTTLTGIVLVILAVLTGLVIRFTPCKDKIIRSVLLKITGFYWVYCSAMLSLSAFPLNTGVMTYLILGIFVILAGFEIDEVELEQSN